jgi:rare lipoprotein A
MPAAILWLIAVFALTGCATGRVGTPPDRRAARPPAASKPAARAVPPAPSRPSVAVPPGQKFDETGEASWYGRAHHGKRTASGQPYDMRKLTAAHRTLPLGTRVLVTNLENGRTVEVTITDRGPFVVDRVIDLSFAAATRLGGVNDGVFTVGLKVLPESATERSPPRD